MIDTDEKYRVQMNMLKYGGDFVSNLGRALMSADTRNAQRIKDAFPDYWDQYLNFEGQ